MSSGLKSNGCNAANAAEPAPTLLTRLSTVPTRLVKFLILLLIWPGVELLICVCKSLATEYNWLPFTASVEVAEISPAATFLI